MKTNTTFKRFIAFTASLMMAVSFASCGSNNSGSVTVKDPDNITEEEFEKAAEKLDSMSEEDFEKALEGKGGIDLGGDTDTGKAAEEEPSEAKPEYEPCDEIKNADFTSGLIQIGNDVFKCGGYLTLREFVEKYGENWDCSGIDLDAPIPTEKPDVNKPDVFYFEIPNKEKSERIINVAYLNLYNSIACNKEASEKYEAKKSNFDIEKSVAFAPYAYLQATLKNNTLKVTGVDVDIYKFYEYPANSTLGDAIVYDVRPNVIAKQITFYPKGMTWATEGDKDFVLNFYKSNSDAEEILDKDTFNNYLGYVKANGYGAVELPHNPATKESALYTNNMLNKTIINWSVNEYAGDFDNNAFSYNIKLKDKNLLEFEPIINLVIQSDETYKVNSIRYLEYQLSDDAIVFGYEPVDTNSSFIAKGGKVTVIS